MLESYEPSVEYDFDPRNLPQEYLAAIGLATAAAAQTESMVEMAIAGHLGIDAEYGGALTTHMTAPLRDHVLRSIAEIRLNNLDDLDALDDILDEIKKAQDKRNSLVHHSWLMDPRDNSVKRLKQSARGSYQLDLEHVTIERIKDEAAFIYTVGIKLMDFLISKNLLPPHPPRNRPRFHKGKAARKKRRKALSAQV